MPDPEAQYADALTKFGGAKLSPQAVAHYDALAAAARDTFSEFGAPWPMTLAQHRGAVVAVICLNAMVTQGIRFDIAVGVLMKALAEAPVRLGDEGAQ